MQRSLVFARSARSAGVPPAFARSVSGGRSFAELSFDPKEYLPPNTVQPSESDSTRRAAPSPILRTFDEPRLDGVVLDVRDYGSEMASITHIAVEVIGRPQAASPVQDGVDRLCRERFPRLNDSRQRGPSIAFDQDMHAVGHDAPGQQPISVAVEMQQCVFDDGGTIVSSKAAVPVATIKKLVYPPTAGSICHGKSGERGRETIGQPESDRLDELRIIEMGQIALECQPFGSADIPWPHDARLLEGPGLCQHMRPALTAANFALRLRCGRMRAGRPRSGRYAPTQE